MGDNPHRIVIELEPSNGFSTKSHVHLADIVRRRVADFIERDGLSTDRMVKSVRIETTTTTEDTEDTEEI